VSLATRPRHHDELRGLVHSLTPLITWLVDDDACFARHRCRLQCTTARASGGFCAAAPGVRAGARAAIAALGEEASSIEDALREERRVARSTTSAGALLLTAWTSGGCSAPAIDDAVAQVGAAIVEGTLDQGDPAVVAVWLGQGACTGTLVSPKVVVTAQHCTVGLSASDVQVFFGTNIDGAGDWFDVAHLEEHTSGDIAALTLTGAGPAAPMPLSDHAMGDGDQGLAVRIVGFGVTSEWGQDDGTKRQATTELVSWDADFLYIDGHGADTCYGDSGGPAFIDFGEGERLAGVTSFGTAQCGNELSGETRVDTYLEWVRGYIDAHDPAQCGVDARCADGCTDPDPDCPCAADGLCTAACTDAASDPDCATTCAADGDCRADCGAMDPDCCVADGSCDGPCGASDPDCDPNEDDGSGSGDGAGDDAEPRGDEAEHGPDGAAAAGCRASGQMPVSPDGCVAFVAALAGLAGVRRRRRTG
jgi:hypothetical protein